MKTMKESVSRILLLLAVICSSPISRVNAQALVANINTDVTLFDAQQLDFQYSPQMVVDPARHRLYEVGTDSSQIPSVAVIDTVNNTLVAKWPVPWLPEVGFSAIQGIALNPIANKIYVPIKPGTLAVLDSLNGAALHTMPIPYWFHAIAVNPNTNRVYLWTENRMLVIDGDNYGVTTIDLPVPSNVNLPSHNMAVNSRTNKLYLGLAAMPMAW